MQVGSNKKKRSRSCSREWTKRIRFIPQVHGVPEPESKKRWEDLEKTHEIPSCNPLWDQFFDPTAHLTSLTCNELGLDADPTAAANIQQMFKSLLI